ncbi:MAG: lamin tail domain-containing protein [Phototrophicaceae bacterium]
MKGRGLFSVVLLNIILSAGVAWGIITIFGDSQSTSQIVPITVQVRITNTPDIIAEGTRVAQVVNATVTAVLETFSSTQSPEIELPADIAQELQAQPTINPDVLAANPQAQDLSESLPPGCVLHEVQSGDTPFGIAEQYGANGFNIMLANGLTEETASNLQIGQVLIIPLGDCPLENFINTTPTVEPTADVTQTPEATSGTPSATSTPTVTPTATLSLAPTATNAKVEIVRILKSGDITLEGVEIQNRGEAVNLSGWTLTDADDNVFEFPEQLLFTNGIVTVYSRAGEDTPIALFWGRSAAVWNVGTDVATLKNANGEVQSTVRITAP